jgi:hypothetical protein
LPCLTQSEKGFPCFLWVLPCLPLSLCCSTQPVLETACSLRMAGCRPCLDMGSQLLVGPGEVIIPGAGPCTVGTEAGSLVGSALLGGPGKVCTPSRNKPLLSASQACLSHRPNLFQVHCGAEQTMLKATAFPVC